MKQYNVIFGGTVKNAEPYIKNILQHIDKCGEKFNKYSVIIYENDSNDNTKKYLLENKKDNYYYILENGVTEERRTMRLEHGRNKILEKAKELNKNGEYTYFIMLDMDDVNSSGTFVESIESCFKYNYDDWDVLTGNQKDNYYDIWALRKSGYIDYDCWGEYHKPSTSTGKKQEIDNIINGTIFKKNGLVEVDSAFGAIGIYKIDLLHNCKYVGEHKNNEYPENSELCEHVEFNKCIKKNGGKIYINTEFYTN